MFRITRPDHEDLRFGSGLIFGTLAGIILLPFAFIALMVLGMFDPTRFLPPWAFTVGKLIHLAGLVLFVCILTWRWAMATWRWAMRGSSDELKNDE